VAFDAPLRVATDGTVPLITGRMTKSAVVDAVDVVVEVQAVTAVHRQVAQVAQVTVTELTQ
jgi:hypothetical protein